MYFLCFAFCLVKDIFRFVTLNENSYVYVYIPVILSFLSPFLRTLAMVWTGV